jgi:RNA polymerase primary sigma factor
MRNRANYLDTYIPKYKNYTADEQIELVKKAQKGDAWAVDQLVGTNLRFVMMVAKQYIGQGIPFDDLVAEGCIGVLKAIEHFDPKVGTKLLTYASWWIRQTILQALLEQTRQVRLPANRVGLIQQYGKASSRLDQELSREANEYEILEDLELNSSDIIRQFSVSYDTENEDGGSLLDMLVNSESESPEAWMNYESLKEEMRLILKKLPKREEEILRLCFGIGYERSYTLEEIGEKLNLTRERIRQLRNKALRTLRRLDRRNQLENLKGY